MRTFLELHAYSLFLKIFEQSLIVHLLKALIFETIQPIPWYHCELRPLPYQNLIGNMTLVGLVTPICNNLYYQGKIGKFSKITNVQDEIIMQGMNKGHDLT